MFTLLSSHKRLLCLHAHSFAPPYSGPHPIIPFRLYGQVIDLNRRALPAHLQDLDGCFPRDTSWDDILQEMSGHSNPSTGSVRAQTRTPQMQTRSRGLNSAPLMSSPPISLAAETQNRVGSLRGMRAGIGSRSVQPIMSETVQQPNKVRKFDVKMFDVCMYGYLCVRGADG
jgi:hypothetical protein